MGDLDVRHVLQGVMCFVVRVPERWFPGKFDIWFQRQVPMWAIECQPFQHDLRMLPVSFGLTMLGYTILPSTSLESFWLCCWDMFHVIG